ncbi:MAG: peptidylprolyl isomerase [Pseudomonadota bacterium]
MYKGALIAALFAGAAHADGLEIVVEGQHTSGTVTIDLLEDVAPNHVAQIVALAEQGYYNNVYFHRVIDGFMAQTGDGEFGKVEEGQPVSQRAGTGASEFGDLDAEFSDIAYERGVVGMARSNNPNSANSQFFIMFDEAPFLNGQYTVVGRVTSGMEIVDDIKRGDASTRQITGNADIMVSVTATE